MYKQGSPARVIVCKLKAPGQSLARARYTHRRAHARTPSLFRVAGAEGAAAAAAAAAANSREWVTGFRAAFADRIPKASDLAQVLCARSRASDSVCTAARARTRMAVCMLLCACAAGSVFSRHSMGGGWEAGL